MRLPAQSIVNCLTLSEGDCHVARQAVPGKLIALRRGEDTQHGRMVRCQERESRATTDG
jgi:hypothetical protein